MTNRIKLLFDSVVSELTMLALACCLVLIAIFGHLDDASKTDIATAAGIAAAVIFVGWLIWATTILAGNKTPRQMSPTRRLAVEGGIILLFFVWFIAGGTPVYACPWLLFFLFKTGGTISAYRALRRQ